MPLLYWPVTVSVPPPLMVRSFFREDRRAGFVGFGVGEGIGCAVRQCVLGAVGQGQDGFGRLFRVKRGAVRAGDGHAVQYQPHRVLLPGVYHHLAGGQGAAEYIGAGRRNGQDAPFGGSAGALDGHGAAAEHDGRGGRSVVGGGGVLGPIGDLHRRGGRGCAAPVAGAGGAFSAVCVSGARAACHGGRTLGVPKQTAAGQRYAEDKRGPQSAEKTNGSGVHKHTPFSEFVAHGGHRPAGNGQIAVAAAQVVQERLFNHRLPQRDAVVKLV